MKVAVPLGTGMQARIRAPLHSEQHLAVVATPLEVMAAIQPGQVKPLISDLHREVFRLVAHFLVSVFS